jgi:hypothetical protein
MSWMLCQLMERVTQLSLIGFLAIVDAKFRISRVGGKWRAVSSSMYSSSFRSCCGLHSCLLLNLVAYDICIALCLRGSFDRSAPSFSAMRCKITLLHALATSRPYSCCSDRRDSFPALGRLQHFHTQSCKPSCGVVWVLLHVHTHVIHTISQYRGGWLKRWADCF